MRSPYSSFTKKSFYDLSKAELADERKDAITFILFFMNKSILQAETGASFGFSQAMCQIFSYKEIGSIVDSLYQINLFLEISHRITHLWKKLT